MILCESITAVDAHQLKVVNMVCFWETFRMPKILFVIYGLWDLE